jgi:MFS family permease
MTARMKLRELTLMTSSMIAIVATTAIAASLPKMSEAYTGTPNGHFLVKISLTLPALSLALFAPLMGLVIDRWGRKRLFIMSMVLYGLSGTSGFFLRSLYAILSTRFVLGIAVAGIITCATALIADYSQEADLGNFMGRQSLFMGLGNVVFVSLGGVLADYSWRWPFMIYAIAFLILPGVVFLITEPHRAPHVGKRLPVLKADSIPPARTMFVYLIGFVNMVIYFMVPVYLPFYLKAFPAHSSARVGMLLAVVGLTWGISSSQYYRLKKSLTFIQIVVLAFALMGVAHVFLGWASGYPMVIVALVLIGIGIGLIVPNLNAWLLSFAPPAMKGRMFGGLLFFVCLGQFFSPIITRPLSSAAGVAQSYFVAGFLLLLIAFGCAVFELRRLPLSGVVSRRHPTTGERLFIRRGTVKTQAAHILTKLGVTSRTELAAEATRRSLPSSLPGPDSPAVPDEQPLSIEELQTSRGKRS